MTDGDLGAVYDTLRQLPPVAHRVHKSAPPTSCRVCRQEHGLGELNPAPAIEPAVADLGRLEGIGFPFPVGFERDATGRVTALVAWEIGPTRWRREP